MKKILVFSAFADRGLLGPIEDALEKEHFSVVNPYHDFKGIGAEGVPEFRRAILAADLVALPVASISSLQSVQVNQTLGMALAANKRVALMAANTLTRPDIPEDMRWVPVTFVNLHDPKAATDAVIAALESEAA